jgi:NADPH-dependent methylglyoxal reductase
MPSISKEAVLVTGASGFIAAHSVAQLLSSGFTVVGTLFSVTKAAFVLKSPHPNLSLQIVPDVIESGNFDIPIKGCDVVLHLAAPFGYAFRTRAPDSIYQWHAQDL